MILRKYMHLQLAFIYKGEKDVRLGAEWLRHDCPSFNKLYMFGSGREE